MPNEPLVIVSSRGANRVRSGHPWVYRDDVSAEGVAGGSVVRAIDSRQRLLGKAFYSDRSTIALRFLTSQDVAIDRDFFARRIAQAAHHRTIVAADAQAHRLVSSEGDRLPSLIVDRYRDILVLQTLSQGIEAWKETIIEILEEQFKPRAIVERNEARVRQLEGLQLNVGVVRGACQGEVIFQEGKVRLIADLLRGQKTGTFLDQRENRLAAERYARGSGLDCFSHTGGFALHLARHCARVEAVDSSAEVLAVARRASQLNGLANIEFIEANVFDLLKAYDAEGRHFDTIVLDPPSFTRSRAAIAGALRGYKEINLRALKLLADGGALITCCCSQHVTEDLFVQTLAEAALDARVSAVVVERRAQAADHPILLTVPETLYLKCIILMIRR